MGIDIYLQWDGQEEEEKQAQYEVGFSTAHGRAGYLREAYHGGPYATHILVREAFESDSCTAEIPAAVLRERLTSVTEPVRGCDAGSKAAAMIYGMLKNLMGAQNLKAGSPEPSGAHSTEPQTVEECVRTRYALIYSDCTPEEVEEAVQSYRDFVALAERKEAKTGKPCTVYASY